MRILPKLTDRPEVSVIMAVKNGAATIAASLDSLFAQSLTSWELIIINDGSTDQTLEILQHYQKKDPERIQIYGQENLGLTKSLNRAMKLAKGKFFARLDADDVNMPNRLEKQLFILKRDKYDFLVSRAFKDGHIVPGNFLYLNASAHYLKFDNIFIHGSFFGKREVFLELLYDESFLFAQDYDFAIRLLKTPFKLGYLYEPLYLLGTGPNQVSVQKADKQRELAKKICLFHHHSRLLDFYWSLPSGSFARKMTKLVLSIFRTEGSKIQKVFY